MKYLEELDIGDCFSFSGNHFILTADFKKNGDKLAVCLSNGLSQWVGLSCIIDPIDIFTLDTENNIIAMKERKKDAANTNPNIS